jgi:biotin synthase
VSDRAPTAASCIVPPQPTDGELLRALQLRGDAQAELFAQARAARLARWPDRRVEVRSVVETGNSCRQSCRFCAIPATALEARYVVDSDTFGRILAHVEASRRQVLLLQSGENASRQFIDLMCRHVEAARRTLPDLVLILCFGTLKRSQLQQLRDAGGDRYILKFETASPRLYAEVKPGDSLEEREACLGTLADLGFGVGTGGIIGLPGQTDEDLVGDLRFIGRWADRLCMASGSIFVPGAGTDYANAPAGDLDTTLNFMALLRILHPHLLIPSTSSLEHARPDGQLAGLQAGANVVTIHDGTPDERKELFPIYSLQRITPTEARLRRIVREAGLEFQPEPG